MSRNPRSSRCAQPWTRHSIDIDDGGRGELMLRCGPTYLRSLKPEAILDCLIVWLFIQRQHRLSIWCCHSYEKWSFWSSWSPWWSGPCHQVGMHATCMNPVPERRGHIQTNLLINIWDLRCIGLTWCLDWAIPLSTSPTRVGDPSGTASLTAWFLETEKARSHSFDIAVKNSI